MVILYLVLIFALGSAVGSFLNVVIDRVMSGGSIAKPLRSYCDHCGVTLDPWDMVPILSFFLLAGKCSVCGKPLSLQYPIIESLCALLFAIAFFVLTNQGLLTIWTIGYWFLLVCVMLVVATVDFKFSLIPTSFVYAASLVALFYNYFWLSPPLFVEHIVAAFGAALFFLIVVVATFGRGMGQGDIVLAFLMGMVLGLREVLLAVFLAFLVGAVVALALVAFRRKKFGNAIPFGPFLVLGFFLSLFWGRELLDFYLMMLY